MKNKRSIAIIMTIVMLLPMLTSCSDSKKSSKVVQEDDPWYDSTKFKIDSDIPTGAMTDLSQVCVSEENIYYTYLYTQDLWGSTTSYLDTYDLEGTKIDHVQIVYPEGIRINRFFSISDDAESGGINAIVLMFSGGKSNAAELTIDKKTGDISNVRELLDDTAKAAKKTDASIYDVSRIGEYTIVILDYGMGTFDYQIMILKNNEFVVELDLSALDLRQIFNGFMLDESANTLYAAGLEGGDVISMEFDLSSGQLKNKSSYKTSDENTVNYSDYTPTTDGDMCRIDSLGNIMKLDLTTMTPETVVDTNWYTPYFNPDSNDWYSVETRVLSCSEDTVVLMDTGYKTYNQLLLENNMFENITVLKKADKNPHAGKEIIEIALPLNTGISEYLAGAIYEFNKTDSEYLIRVWDKHKSGFTLGRVVDPAEDEEEVYQMIQDLKGEEAPDLVIGIQQNYAMRDDIFMDLTGFLEPEIMDKQYSNIIEAGAINDKLYFLPVTIEIEGLVTNEDLIPDGAVGITFDDFDKLVEEDMNGYSPYDYPLSTYCNKCSFVLSCIDTKSAIEGENIEFGTDQFYSAVEYANDNFTYFDEASIPEEYLFDYSRNIGECRYAKIDNFFDYLNNSYGSKGSYVIIGTPSIDASGPRFKALETISVSATTDVTEGCKKFINYLFSGVVFESGDCEFWQIVTNKEIMTKNVETLAEKNNLAYDKYTASLGSGMQNVPLDIDLAFGGKTATDVNCDNFLNSLSSISTYYYEDKVITGFLIEELAPYFSGDRSIDDVVTYINDRVTKYVREM